MNNKSEKRFIAVLLNKQLVMDETENKNTNYSGLFKKNNSCSTWGNRELLFCRPSKDELAILNPLQV